MSNILSYCVRVLTFALAMTLGLAGFSWGASLSGTFTGSADTFAALLQIVQTADGHLTGRYEEVRLDGGKLNRWEAAVSGAADRDTVVVNFKPPGILSSALAMSGSFDGTLLRLSGASNGKPIALALSRSSRSAFDVAVRGLSERAVRVAGEAALKEQLKRQQKEKQDQLATLDKVARELVAFAKRGETVLNKLKAADGRYSQITRSMQAALARQRSIIGDGQAGVARSQIAVGINQEDLQANQLHIEVQNSQREFDRAFAAHSAAAMEAAKPCAGARGQPLSTEFAAPCSRLSNARDEFRATSDRLKEAYETLESEWIAESARQKSVAAAAWGR